ncbi:uncharacterized protein G2W53_020275 [Senna tora]|uniref:Uncharacterized protein n=1 Tax=Senna tora TaxID=362788 RepID=A0A834TYR6_9FABA|nr:uncharacterized protein G2W53_020275 [Senna tora]
MSLSLFVGSRSLTWIGIIPIPKYRLGRAIGFAFEVPSLKFPRRFNL